MGYVQRVAVGWVLVVLGCMAMVGVLVQAGYAPVDSGVQVEGVSVVCEQYLPHVDYQAEGQFNAWVSGVVDSTHAVNVEYEHGVWYADGYAVGYGSAEDGAIYNHRECVP